MSKKIWVLCYVDNFGHIDYNNIFGQYNTKKEAMAKLSELKSKYGSSGNFDVRSI